jgi:mannose-6-phosphate isomerase
MALAERMNVATLQEAPDAVSLVAPRLDAKPWGGSALQRYGLAGNPGDTIGEALITANEARVTAGFGAGRTLGEIVANDPARMLTPNSLAKVGGRALFPLLVKLIDAAENLSIQVHPDDAEAAAADSLGKTEAWHVLDASPGSKLYLGLRDPDDLDGFIEAADRLDGSSASHLRAVDAVVGETWLLPAGTVHALGAGVMVYEIQQPSAITYRLDDWGRVDAEGNPREMHREAGLAVLKPSMQPEREVPRQTANGQLLVESAWFSLERWEIDIDEIVGIPPSNGPTVLTVIEGEAELAGVTAKRGETVIVWPEARHVRIEGDNAVLLVGTVPGGDR